MAQSIGCYDGTNTNAIYYSSTIETGQAALVNSTSTYIVFLTYNTSGGVIKQEATITVDATNITLAWTNVASLSSNNMILLWEAEK